MAEKPPCWQKKVIIATNMLFKNMFVEYSLSYRSRNSSSRCILEIIIYKIFLPFFKPTKVFLLKYVVSGQSDKKLLKYIHPWMLLCIKPCETKCSDTTDISRTQQKALQLCSLSDHRGYAPLSPTQAWIQQITLTSQWKCDVLMPI